MADDRIITFNLGSQHVTGAVFSKTAGGGLRLERVEKREFTGDPADDDALAHSASAWALLND